MTYHCRVCGRPMAPRYDGDIDGKGTPATTTWFHLDPTDTSRILTVQHAAEPVADEAKK